MNAYVADACVCMCLLILQSVLIHLQNANEFFFVRASAKYIGVESKVKCFVDDVDVDDGTTIDWLIMIMLWTCVSVCLNIRKKKKERIQK